MADTRATILEIFPHVRRDILDDVIAAGGSLDAMLETIMARSQEAEIQPIEVKMADEKDDSSSSSSSSSSSDEDEAPAIVPVAEGKRRRRPDQKTPVAKVVLGDRHYQYYSDYIGELDLSGIHQRPDESKFHRWYRHYFLAPGWNGMVTNFNIYDLTNWARGFSWGANHPFGDEQAGGCVRLTNLRHLQNIIAVLAWWRYNYGHNRCHMMPHKTEAGNTLLLVEFWIEKKSRELPYTPMLFDMPTHVLTARLFRITSPHRSGMLHRPAMTRVYVGDALRTNLLDKCAQERTGSDRKYLELKWPQGATTFEVRDYQQQSVARMMEIEQSPTWVVKKYADMEGCSSRATGKWYNSHFWHSGLNLLKFRPTGGFNCEEMGLGKTVEMLMLIYLTKDVEAPGHLRDLKHYWTADRFYSRPNFIGKKPDKNKEIFNMKVGDRLIESKATLIICPTSLVATWNMEINKLFVDKPKSVAWYGPKRTTNMAQLAGYDIVVTTAQMVKASCHLSGIKWKRVIIDESHEMLRSGAQVFRTLASDHRWCVSGTPINVSKPKVLGSQLHFLGFDNIQNFSVPIANDDSNMLATTYVFKNLVVRHTKTQPFGDRKELLVLPDCVLKTVSVPFDAQWQKDGYRATVTRARREYKPGMSGPQVALLYSRVRRFCSLPKEVKEGHEGNRLSDSKMDVAADGPMGVDLANIGNEMCPLCLDVFDHPVQTKCRHVFCLLCLDECLQRSQQAGRQNVPCPNCRAPVEGKDVKMVNVGNAMPIDEAKEAKNTSHKINRLKTELKNMPAEDKTVIFCEFAETLFEVKKAVEEVLGKKACVTLGGEMNAKRRQKSLEQFTLDKDARVMIIAYRIGAVGLTLTAANRVILFDVATDRDRILQAVCRIYRQGQTRNVSAEQWVTPDTVEAYQASYNLKTFGLSFTNITYEEMKRRANQLPVNVGGSYGEPFLSGRCDAEFW